MSRKRRISRPRHQPQGTPQQRGGYTRQEWCALRGVAERTWYGWKSKGLTPATSQPGGPRGWEFISFESDAEWLRRNRKLANVVTAAE
jgi:hypothetical protein